MYGGLQGFFLIFFFCDAKYVHWDRDDLKYLGKVRILIEVRGLLKELDATR